MSEKTRTKFERLEKISADVLSKGEVTVDDLARKLSVSRMTIHRDLEELETRGVLRKIRNGATAQPSSVFESNVEFRITRSILEKERLAAYAAKLVEPGDVILLDESTTLLPMIPHLAEIEGLTIVSNFLPVQAAVSKMPHFRLIGLCGEYVRQFDTFSGALCEMSISRLRINRYFTSTTAIDGASAFHPNALVASTKRAMMKASVQRYMLADHSKFSRTALHKFADLDEFDQIFVDKSPSLGSVELLEALREKITVIPK